MESKILFKQYFFANLKKVVYHSQMGKDNNLVEMQTFSSEFHLPKRRSIYGFGNCRDQSLSLYLLPLSLFLSFSLSLFRGGERLLHPPSGSATDFDMASHHKDLRRIL